MLAPYYLTILTLHSDWRWIVLVSLLLSVLIALRGLASRTPFVPGGRFACRLAIVAVDVQLLLGLCLYAASPLVHGSWENIAAAMKQHEPRFFSIEHPTAMLLAVVLAHVGSYRSRRVQTDRSAYLNVAGWFAGSLALILAGFPWWRPLFRALGLA
jgi:hypothetical protein